VSILTCAVSLSRASKARFPCVRASSSSFWASPGKPPVPLPSLLRPLAMRWPLGDCSPAR
jgi:hypothetical protein